MTKKKPMKKKLSSIEDLKPALYNPRTITESALAGLGTSIEKFGDLSGIVWNSQTGNLVAGHQRVDVLKKAGAEFEDGCLMLGKKKFPVRIVNWDLTTEKAANITANNPQISGDFIDGDLESLLSEMKEGMADFEELMLGNLLEELGMGESGGEDDNENQTLQDRFGVPPFSVLDARQGYWQDRKRAWINLGIISEEGRDEGVLMPSIGGRVISYYKMKTKAEFKIGHKLSNKEFEENHLIQSNKGVDSGTSLFDPVLCELVYRWFSPPGGTILDPFAGGSVRGIVAAKTGRKYTGIDLRKEQVEANRAQAEKLLKPEKQEKTDTVEAYISGKWASHKFSCSMKYIKSTCKGRCCQGADKILVSLLPEEQKAHKKKGFSVEGGLLKANPKTGLCPHKKISGLCGVHGTVLKPFGCIASPFTINSGKTLVIRNRYSKMKCHGTGDPAYKTFRASLDLILGEVEAARACKEIELSEGKKIRVSIPKKNYDAMKYLDGIKHGANDSMEIGKAKWIMGDSRDIPKIVKSKEFDFVFSCPPYADLESYSDDPKDLSTLKYDEFIKAYRDIIGKACAKLADNRFACFVVGDIRDEAGNYRNFVSDTIQAFLDAGLSLYNEAILVTSLGSLPIRAGRSFAAGRKLGKTHQNVLVFVKGNGRAAADNVGAVEFGLMEIEE